MTAGALREAPDYEELKWYLGLPVVIAAFGGTWKRLPDQAGYSELFVLSEDNENEDFYGEYGADEPIEPSD